MEFVLFKRREGGEKLGGLEFVPARSCIVRY
jgi:hypothetical protein